MAPEIVEKKEYAGPPADIWALGVLLYALLCGCFPYKGATDEELYARICACSPFMHPHLSQKVRKFFRAIFTYEADYRPCSYTVLNEPWIIAHFDEEEENP